MSATPATISLLYPTERPPTSAHGVPDAADLGLDTVIAALDLDGQHRRFIAALLAELNADPATIRYRQDVLADLLRLPDLTEHLRILLPHLRDLSGSAIGQRWLANAPLLQVASRLAELDNYVRCVTDLSVALDAVGEQLHAAGLHALRAYLATVRADPEYQQLATALPDLRERMGQAGSITIGVNLDPELSPESATIVSVNRERFAGRGTLLERLLGERSGGEAVRGITALFKAADGRPHTPEHELFRDMARLLERVAAPVAAVLERYRRVNAGPLAEVAPELAFYLGAVQLTEQIRAAGLPLCRPEIAPLGERVCVIEQNYSLDLALRMRHTHPETLADVLVTNQVVFQEANLALLSGPNSGGKTTYTRAIGQAQTLFQAGLLVSGSHARISPVDGVYTHFATAERLDADGGRLAQELERMAAIFATASPASLLLINEPFASTDHQAARALGRDLVAGLCLLGARTILVTHLHELVDDALASHPGAILPLYAGSVLPADNGRTDPRPNYRIERGRPQTHSHATELARRYGLSREQIAQTLRQRGLTDTKE